MAHVFSSIWNVQTSTTKTKITPAVIMEPNEDGEYDENYFLDNGSNIFKINTNPYDTKNVPSFLIETMALDYDIKKAAPIIYSDGINNQKAEINDLTFTGINNYNNLFDNVSYYKATKNGSIFFLIL